VPKLGIHVATPSLPVTYLFREAQRRRLYRFRVESLAIFKMILEERVDAHNPTLTTTTFPVR